MKRWSILYPGEESNHFHCQTAFSEAPGTFLLSAINKLDPPRDESRQLRIDATRDIYRNAIIKNARRSEKISLSTTAANNIGERATSDMAWVSVQYPELKQAFVDAFEAETFSGKHDKVSIDEESREDIIEAFIDSLRGCAIFGGKKALGAACQSGCRRGAYTERWVYCPVQKCIEEADPSLVTVQKNLDQLPTDPILADTPGGDRVHVEGMSSGTRAGAGP